MAAENLISSTAIVSRVLERLRYASETTQQMNSAVCLWEFFFLREQPFKVIGSENRLEIITLRDLCHFFGGRHVKIWVAFHPPVRKSQLLLQIGFNSPQKLLGQGRE